MRHDGLIESIVGEVPTFPGWCWSLRGNWYERATGRYVHYWSDGSRGTRERDVFNLTGHIDGDA